VQYLYSRNNLILNSNYSLFYQGGFPCSSKCSDLSQNNFPLLLELVKLSISGDLKQQSIIFNEFLLGWNDIEQDNSEEIDELLNIAIPNEAR